MTTGTSSGNSSRTERSVEQIEDSVRSDVEFDGHEELLATHAKTFGWSPSIAGNIGPEKYWEGAKRKISTVCLASFSKLPVVCVCSF